MMLERWTSIALAGIAACTSFAIYQVDRLPMIDGRVIFLVEVALAVGIGLFVFQYSRHTDRIIERHVDESESMAKRNERAKQVRRNRSSHALHSTMRVMAGICSRLVETGGMSADATASEWESLKSHVAGLHSQVNGHLDSLGRDLESADHLDSGTYDKIRDAVNFWDTKVRVDDSEKVIDTTQYRVMLDMTNFVLPRLEQHLGQGTGVPSVQFRPAETISRSDRLVIVLDRYTYPPGAPVHVSLNAAGRLPDRKVVVTILDMDLKVLVQKTAVAPGHSTHPIAPFGARLGLRGRRMAPGGPGSGSGAARVVDLIPKGTVEGGQYIVRAACGGIISETVFGVDKRPPAVQTNKSEFLVGEDMIVTVIDPAANKDGSKRDYAGASDRSRLVIDSPHGRIDGYRLKETGDSTGVFQGRVRVIGVRNDGSIKETEIDGARVDKTQGRGSEDGAIPCGPGQAIHLRYMSKFGSGATTVLGIGVDPVVELDRKKYACFDRVGICVIAPRIAGGEEAPPAIGDSRRDSWVSISSGEGSIEGYRLTETGPGNGIFMGTVSLTGLAAMGDGGPSPGGGRHGETGGTGPDGGRLACGADDAVTVRVTSAFAAAVSASARIRQRTGTSGG